MSDNQYYRLHRDEDGHWYVVPVGEEYDVEGYFEAVYNYWYNHEGELPEEPDWLIEVGGHPSDVHFKEYKIR